MSSLKTSFAHFINVNPRIPYVLSFLVPLAVRGLPEVLMGKYIIGFDTTSYYVPITLRWLNDGANFWEFMASAPLFYAMLTGLTFIGIPLNVSLKLLPPILHGSLGLAIYLYARKALEWPYGKSLFVSCLATIYFVALRVSWDMLRNELGLIFLFIFLIFLHENLEEKSWKSYALLLPIMILTVLTHQLVAIIMLAIIFVFIIQRFFNHERVAARNLVLSTLPATALFILITYAEFAVSTSFSIVNGFQSAESIGWLSLFGFTSYLDTLAYSIGFFLYCYLFLLPFILIGIKHFRNLELRIWLFWCLILPLSSIFSPYAYRWTLLLIFPAAFFAIEGFGRFDSKLWKKLLSGVLILLSGSFILLPAEFAFPYFGIFTSYVPSSMLQNSIPLCDCRDVETALLWTRNILASDGILLVHDAFHGWALTFLDRSRVTCYGYENPKETAEKMFSNGYNRLFLVWWVPGEGWHKWTTLPSCFVEIFRSNRIAIYTYNSTV